MSFSMGLALVALCAHLCWLGELKKKDTQKQRQRCACNGIAILAGFHSALPRREVDSRSGRKRRCPLQCCGYCDQHCESAKAPVPKRLEALDEGEPADQILFWSRVPRELASHATHFRGLRIRSACAKLLASPRILLLAVTMICRSGRALGHHQLQHLLQLQVDLPPLPTVVCRAGVNRKRRGKGRWRRPCGS